MKYFKRTILSSSKLSSKAGFTLIEILVVTVIIAFSFVMLVKLQRQAVLEQVTNELLAEIRNMQLSALSGKKYDIDGDGTLERVCGVGITNVIGVNSKTDYYIYATYVGDRQCFNSDGTINFQGRANQGDAYRVSTDKTIGSLLQFEGEFENFQDMLFISPEGKVVINGKDIDVANPESEGITIKLGNGACNSVVCKTICVYDYGKVEVFDDKINC